MLTFNQRRGVFLAVFAFMCACVAMTSCGRPAYAEEAIEPVGDDALCAVDAADGLEAVDDAEPGVSCTARWERIAGANALQTMREVVRTDGVFADGRGGSVLLCAATNYKDALAASGLAGMLDAPVLITNGASLSRETAQEIERLRPSWVGIVGGAAAVGDEVEWQVGQYGFVRQVDRIAGKSAVGTANKLYQYGRASGAWGHTAIVVTGNGYKDALSIAPYAYWSHSPVFLTRSSDNPDCRVIPGNALADLAEMARRPQGIERVVIVGGTLAVSADVERLLDNLGVPHIRIWGRNAIETSEQCARLALYEGMGLEHMTVATTASYKDALCAGPVCGKLGSVMVLCNPTGGLQAFSRVCDYGRITHGHVLGGELAIGASNFGCIAYGR